MAHFAQLDGSNIVTAVIVVHNNESPDEESGAAFLVSLYGPSTWKQTSYTSSMRKNFAGIGFEYDEGLDAFIPPRPFPSWVFDSNICRYVPPVTEPDSGGPYVWSEESKAWVLLK